MSAVIIVGWVFLAFLCALMATYSFFLGDFIVRAGFRWSERDRMRDYRKWRVERDLFYPGPFWGFIAWGAMYVVSVSVTFLLSAIFTSFLIQRWPITNNVLEGILSIAMIALVGGGSLAFGKAYSAKEKVRKLTALPLHFQQRFSVAELLSVYEALRFAPTVLWEDYADLDESQISHDSNRKFKEDAAPFRHNRLIVSHINMLIITTSMLLLMIITAAITIVSLFRWL